MSSAAPKVLTRLSPRSLYREWTRLQQQWPAEPTRPGRNLKDLIDRRLKSAFTATDNQDNVTLTRASAAECQRHLEDAQRLVRNEALTRYPLPRTFTPVHRDAYRLLDTEVQQSQSKIRIRSIILPTLRAWIQSKFKTDINNNK
jgi:hypothetical protein